MKPIHLSLLLLLVCNHLLAQTTTNYGTSTGTVGDYSSYFGYEAGKSAVAGERNNTFVGHQSGKFTTTGGGNTAVGDRALSANVTGFSNTAVGAFSLFVATSAHNTSIGHSSMSKTTTGSTNTSVGDGSMSGNTTGSGNVSLGFYTLHMNTTADENTAVGNYAMHLNFTGAFNTAIGSNAVLRNRTGSGNTGGGYYALYNSNSGHFNTAFGYQALQNNVSGSLNSAFGMNAGPSVEDIMNTTALGNGAVTTASNQVRIGNSSVTSIGGKVSWSTLSDGRFKKEIREDVSGLEFINQLRPVSYVIDEGAVNRFLHIKDNGLINEARSKPFRQTGFIAQEVEAVIKKTGYVFHGVEVPQSDADHYSIRYAEFVVPLVKAVQELTSEVEALKQQLNDAQSGANGESTKDIAELYQNNPNPFSADTEISMSLPEITRSASVILYNLEGKQLKVIPVGGHGKISVNVQRGEMPAGMYIYALLVDGKVVDSKKMILTGE